MIKEPSIIERILQNRILSHVLFWLSTLLIFPIYGMGFGMPLLVGVIIKSFFLPVQILATYYLIYYQIPIFLYTQRYTLFFLSLLLSAIIFCMLGHLVNDFFITPRLAGYAHEPHTILEILKKPFSAVGYHAQDIYPTVFIAAILKFIKQRIEAKTNLDILAQEKATAEINLLKAQINPKILSKTLHQLHTLTKEKSDAAPEVVIKLSEMLDYMLYQCNSPKVLVNNEIELIQNYLDLEKLRFGEAISISFFHYLDNPSAEIAPLLLVSLVEAAFLKKGEILPDNAEVEIILKEKNEQLDFKILSNLTAPTTITTNNFTKQLDLLYPNQYRLEIGEKRTICTIELTLNLYPVNP